MNSGDVDRDPVEALAAEFMERQRRGEYPSIEEYTRRYPELADEIRDLFPTVAALEGFKLDKVGRQALEGRQGPPGYLGDFRIIREIGRGGMGIVYEAEQESLGRRVALKVLPQQALLDATKRRRFEREARTAARLHHTNIVPVFGVGEQDGLHYYVMQLIRGVGLDAVIKALRRDHAPGQPTDDRPEQPANEMTTTSFTPRQAAQALRSGAFSAVAKEAAPASSDSATHILEARPAPVEADTPARAPRAGPHRKRFRGLCVCRGPTGKMSPAWVARWPTPWPTRTRRTSCTATSSLPTSCWMPPGTSGLPTLAWPRCWNRTT
jgi:hypothetical protein